LLKRGTTNNLLVNFIGGGASWNEETAARPYTPAVMLKRQEAFYMSDVINAQLRFADAGLFKASDKRNPFRDWHMLNIPYVSGDFHLENTDYPYQSLKGEAKTLHHHGQKNVSAALALLKELCPETPEILMVMGLSAGGFGCLAHAPQIQHLYPLCKRVVVYSEGAHIDSPIWPQIAKDIWNVRPDLLPYIKSESLIADLFRYARDHMPPTTQFLHANSVWDAALASFMHKKKYGTLQANATALEEFRTSLAEIVRTLKLEIPNYHVYLTDHGKNKDGATPHTFAGTPKLLFGNMQDGISVATWLKQATTGKAFDVGEKFMA
jgi:hypothetical protein